MCDGAVERCVQLFFTLNILAKMGERNFGECKTTIFIFISEFKYELCLRCRVVVALVHIARYHICTFCRATRSPISLYESRENQLPDLAPREDR